LGSRTVGLFDQPGLFRVPRRGPNATTTAGEAAAAVFAHPWPGRSRSEPRRGRTNERALHRHCSGCSRETEHVSWATGGPTNIPSIQWPAAEPAAGTTLCLDCGQLRARASRSRPPAWSSWPRKPLERATRLARAPMEAESARAFDDGAAEAAAENEGMPERPEPLNARVVLRPREAAVSRRGAVQLEVAS
jgi:hypothetical protein